MSNENRTCQNCNYFQELQEPQDGICCIRSPQIVTAIDEEGVGTPQTEWPIVETGDWCGEFAKTKDSSKFTAKGPVGGAVAGSGSTVTGSGRTITQN